MRFARLISLCVAAILAAGMVDARSHLYDHLERSDISLASAYINNIPADEIITKRSENDNDGEEVHHRIDITNREYLESRAQAQHKRQSHYKFRIGSDGKPVRRGFMERREETSTEEEEEEILPAAALPIRKRSVAGMRVLARGE